MKWSVIGWAVVVAALLASMISEITRTLVLGWIAFLSRTLPKVTVNPVGVLSGIIALGLLAGILHGFAKWWSRERGVGGGQQSVEVPIPGFPVSGSPHLAPRSPLSWRFRWTLGILVLLIVMFATGYSAIGLARQLGWLLSSDEPLYGERIAWHWSTTSQRTLQMIGLGVLNYHEVYRQYPPGGTYDESGESRHGWVTRILPYLWYDSNQIRMDLPWNHPENARYFRCVLPEVINPEFRTPPLFDEDGFGLAHYAGNCRVLRPGTALAMPDLEAGTSSTILVGEVNARFKPWGHPANIRDPAMGINVSPDGFGGPESRHRALLLMADGSVRSLDQQVDPAVLQALAGPKSSKPLEATRPASPDRR